MSHKIGLKLTASPLAYLRAGKTLMQTVSLKNNFPNKQQVFSYMLHYFPTHYLCSSDLVMLGFGQFH
jgi:hypothetical protein